MNKQQIDNIPTPLKTMKQWVCFNLVPNGKIGGKPIKVPMIPGFNIRASISKPGNWRDFPYTIAQSHKYNGIGFVFTAQDSFTGIDIDNCRNSKTGELAKSAKKIMEKIGSYTEVSYSKTGIHIIITGAAPAGRKKFPLHDENYPDMGIEIYSQDRYFIVTGDRISPTNNIYSRGKLIERLHAKLMEKYPDLEPEPEAVSPITEGSKPASNQVHVQEFDWDKLDTRTLNKKLIDYKTTGNESDFDAAYDELKRMSQILANKHLGKNNDNELTEDMKLFCWGYTDNCYDEWLTIPMVKSLKTWNPNRQGPKLSFKNYFANKVVWTAKDTRGRYRFKKKAINKDAVKKYTGDLAPLQLCVEKFEKTQRYTNKDDAMISGVSVEEFYSHVLTERQAQILQLFVEGYKQIEIASMIGIGRNKIANHLNKIREKAEKYFLD